VKISEPLVSRFGVHLIQLLERRQATLSQREQRDIARNLVREKKLEEAYTMGARGSRPRLRRDSAIRRCPHAYCV
jgi:peptidyl-prolyl cis-trans isomerase SurA